MEISLNQIVEKLSHYNVSLAAGNGHSRIERLRFFTEEGELYGSKTLCVCSKDCVADAVGHSITNMLCYPEVNLDILPSGVNCIVIPTEKPWQALNDIANLLTSSCTVEKHYSQFVKSLVTGTNLEQVLSAGRELVHNPIKLLSTTFEVLNPERDETQREKALFIALYKDEVIRSRVASSGGPVLVEIPEEYRRRSGSGFKNSLWSRIVYHGSVIGYIMEEEFLTPISPDNYGEMRLLSEIVSLSLKLDKYARYTNDSKATEIIRSLFSNKTAQLDKDMVASRLSFLGWEVPKKLKIAAIVPVDMEDKAVEHQLVMWELERRMENVKTLWFDNRIIMLAPMESVSENQSWLESYLVENGLCAGISQTFDDIRQVYEYYKYALDALRVGKQISAGRRLFFYDDYAIYYPMESYTASCDILHLCHPAVARLYEYDKQKKTELTRTLYIYLANQQNAINAAKELHLHRNTMYYRLDKINEIAGIGAGELSDMSFNLLYSLEILKFKKML